MRRRATFITDDGQDFDPKVIVLKGRHLKHSGIPAAREEKLTFGLNELPTELADVLKQSRELHIRWTHQDVPYKNSAPFTSRLIPGLHVHYTPLNQHPDKLLCNTLGALFSDDIKCDPIETTFTRPSLVSERFTSSTSLQFHSLVPSLDNLVQYIEREICSASDITCSQTTSLLTKAQYLDIDYDSISHALVLTVFWPSPGQTPGTSLTEPLDITATSSDRVEVGILSSSPATDAHEIQMQGVLVVVGEDEHPKPTMFSFPSRHHTLPQKQSSAQQYMVSFAEPVGLHPILEITFPSAKGLQPPESKPEDSQCALHAYFTLPSAIFADQYAFPTTTADALFEEAHHIKFLRSISGELDLEAPDYVIEKWGSTMLLELSEPHDLSSSNTSHQAEWKVTIPLHLRYLPPSSTQSHRGTTIPGPNIFWACTAEEGTKFPTNPFDRIHLGYDTLFGPRTMFYHVPSRNKAQHANLEFRSFGSKSALNVQTIRVPVLDTSKVGGDRTVQWGTLVVVLLGFGWVVVKLWPAVAGLFDGAGRKQQQSKVRQKQR